jgi:predicted ATPase
MIISFTGAQSTGKTTLLTKCKELYPDYEFVDEVTRLVKREYNVDINEGGTDITQLLIINQHIQNAFRHIPENKKGVIMDRCIVDGLVYTTYLAVEDKVSRWVAEYARNVFNLLINRVDKIFYTWPGDVPLVDDGERSANNEFRDKIITTFDLLFETYKDTMKDKLIILKGTVDERLNLIKETLC